MMKQSINSSVAILALYLVNPSSEVQAQVLDDIENAVTRGNQFNESVSTLTEQDAQQGEEAKIDGEAGVFILKRNEIFSIKAIAGTGYSDNPSRTLDTGDGGSAAAQFAVSAGVDTLINQQIDAGASLVVSGTEYSEDGAPDSRNVVANAYAGKSLLGGNFFASLSGSYGQAMNGTFDDGTAFYGLNASLTTQRFISERLLFRPRLTLARQWSEVSEQENTSATIAAEFVWAVASKWQANGSVSFTHRIYDDFFEDVTFVERKDDVWRGSVGVSRQINDKVSLSANITYVDQSSDFFLSEYETLDGGISLNLRRRF